MAIQSISYLLFVLAVWLLARPLRTLHTRQALFLAASYIFYASWGLVFLAVLIVSSLLNYIWGYFLRRRPTAARLWVAVSSNLLLLGIFKYLPSLAGITAHTGALADVLHSIVMPIGISFWTFQALSYLFDVYREEDLDPSLMEFCLYMAFWPTVLSGPICRLPNMLPQFRQASGPKWNDIEIGTRRLAIGLFMKVVLAKLLEVGINPGEGVAAGFDQITSGWGGIDVWVLAIGFGFQLYFDFAGYSHMVIGTARLFGFRLDENFDHPYLSTTPSVFWTRWHMSLSFWIRDYVFFPLATLRRNVWWRNIALVVSMILFGLWHKASMPFLLWGTYHGCVLLAHRQGQQLQRRLHLTWPRYLQTAISWAMTFALISLGWIFFRAHDLRQILVMLMAVVSPGGYHQLALPRNSYSSVSLLTVGYFLLSGIDSWKSQVSNFEEASASRRVLNFLSEYKWWWLAPTIVSLLIFGILVLFAGSSSASPFMYTMF